MPTRSAPPRTEHRETIAPAPNQQRPGIDPLARERLNAAHSFTPGFYSSRRDKSAQGDHTIETLERISSALCTPPAGPVAVCGAAWFERRHGRGVKLRVEAPTQIISSVPRR